MGLEVERKFLVNRDAWLKLEKGPSVSILQGYLSTDNERTVRVRLMGSLAYLTIKGITRGYTRREFEYAIPAEDALWMIQKLCVNTIEKERYTIRCKAHTWEVDVFHGQNEGLILAEIELSHEEEDFNRPIWIGAEVSHDFRYFNSYLAEHPYCDWK